MNLHINCPSGVYVAQIRQPYHKLWKTVSEHSSKKDAEIASITAMSEDYKKARVLFCAEWYDPVLVMEASR
jgi:hypothetical protein